MAVKVALVALIVFNIMGLRRSLLPRQCLAALPSLALAEFLALQVVLLAVRTQAAIGRKTAVIVGTLGETQALKSKALAVLQGRPSGLLDVQGVPATGPHMTSKFDYACISKLRW
jgi:hypothetical protein